jgi:hypothetical protein
MQRVLICSNGNMNIKQNEKIKTYTFSLNKIQTLHDIFKEQIQDDDSRHFNGVLEWSANTQESRRWINNGAILSFKRVNLLNTIFVIVQLYLDDEIVYRRVPINVLETLMYVDKNYYRDRSKCWIYWSILKIIISECIYSRSKMYM